MNSKTPSSSRPTDVPCKIQWNYLKPQPETVLFVSYDPEAKIQDYVVYFLSALKEIGYQIVLIQQIDQHLYPDFVPENKISRDLVDVYLTRENVGYDISAWAHAMQILPELWSSDVIIFTNDSIIGPLNKIGLQTIARKISSSTAAYIGLTESFQYRHHLQSYFFAFKNFQKNQVIFREFWDSIRQYNEYFEIIFKYEICQLNFFLSRGLTYEALFPVQKFLNGRFHDTPTFRYWEELIQIGFPFLKVKVIRQVADSADWRRVLAKTAYPIELIDSFLSNRLKFNPNFISKKKEKKISFLKKLEKSIRYFLKEKKEKAKDVIVPFPVSNSRLEIYKEKKLIAILLHVSCLDTASEILSLLANFPVPYALFVSTHTEEMSRSIQESAQSFHLEIDEIKIIPDRGRNILPFYVVFQDVYKVYPYFLHLQSTANFLTTDKTKELEKYLFKNLIGTEAIITANLSLLSESEVGVVYVRPLDYLPSDERWGLNKNNATVFLARLSMLHYIKDELEFPIGGMYWGKSAILNNLLALELTAQDFEEEAGQLDGTVAHVIERLPCLLAKKAGYKPVRIFCPAKLCRPEKMSLHHSAT